MKSIEDAAIGAGVMAGAANVIMQLSWPGVGYGVYESPVESGSVFRHPLKRFRTTMTYLAVAIFGTEREKAAYRKWVNRSHRLVRSTAASPVRYNAFDPELQLWVAACLYKGFEDTYMFFAGPLEGADRESFYASSATLGTTLQVRPEAWPADRAAFEEYWTDGQEKIRIDPEVRDYLYRVATLRMFPAFVRVPLGRPHLFLTTGFLPPRFREEMRLPWSERDQRRFDRLTRATGMVVRRLPAPVRRFPYNFYLWDMRLRTRLGLPLL